MNIKSKLVIFDLDGTLVDSQDFIVSAIKVAFETEQLSIPRQKDILSIIGLSLSEAFRVLDKSLNEIQVANLIKAFKNCYDTFSRDQIISPLYPNVNRFLINLSRYEEVSFAIATGKGKTGLTQVLKAHNLEHIFSGLQTSDDNPSKPDPTMLFKLMDAHQVNPEDTLMIGDTNFDILMAHKANIKSIAVLWGYHSKALLVSAKPNALASNFNELDRMVSQLLWDD